MFHLNYIFLFVYLQFYHLYFVSWKSRKKKVLTESDFCFLDEPFSGLDPVSIFKLKSFLCDDIEKNRTYIISTHQLAILESIVIPDELMVILLMKDGKLIHQGTKKNLLESTGEESIEKAYIKLS